MADAGIKVVGLNEAIRTLKLLGTPGAEIAKAGQESADLIANEARTLVPVKSGKLKGSIRTAKLQRRVVVRAGGTRVPYANPIHWGWFRRGIMPNPFFSKALKENIDEVYKRYFKNLEALFEKNKATKK